MADRNLIIREWRNALGRDPSNAEIAFLSSAVDRGDIELGDIAPMAQATPEFQQGLAQRQTADYAQTLGKYDQDILNQASASINSNLASLGRSGSSSYAGAMAQAARDLAIQRQGQVASFYGQRLSNVAGAYQQRGEAPLSNIYGQRAAQQNAQREFDFWKQQYNIERNAYEDYLNRQSRFSFTRDFLQPGINAGWQALGRYAGPKSGSKPGA